MAILIDKVKCTGCSQCVKICPGNLVRLDVANKAYLRKQSDCWSCCACMKECKFGAISIVLPPEMQGKGACLTAKRVAKSTEWTIIKPDGTKYSLVTNADTANTY